MLQHFRTAVTVIHERIRIHKDCVSEDVRAVLEAIEAHLFDPDFKVGSLNLARATRNRFSEQLDATPDLYLKIRRIEVALYLLDYTDAKVPEISAKVAFRKVHSFIHTFKKLMDRSPIQERRYWRGLQAEGKEPVPASLLSRRPLHSRAASAPGERRALVGALRPRSAAFHLATLRLRPTDDLQKVFSEWLDTYLESCSGDPEAIPEDPCHPFQPEIVPMEEEDRLLREAARPTLEILDSFAEDAPEYFQPLLAELCKNVAMPGGTLEDIKEDLRTSSLDLASFTRAVGISPWQYVLEARMEIASRLLRDSPLSVQVIACLVGYSDPPQFRRVFKRWSGGLSPNGYRSRIRHVVSRVGLPPEAAVHWRYRDMIRPDGASELIRYLERVYSFPPSDGNSGEG